MMDIDNSDHDDPTNKLDPPNKQCSEQILNRIAELITQVCEVNDKKIDENYDRSNVYHDDDIPGISISDYIHRLSNYTECSEQAIITGMIYLKNLQSKIMLNSWTAHRLLFVSVVMGAKYIDDCRLNNENFSQVGGLDTEELFRLEKDFILKIEWRTEVENEEFERCRNSLIKG